MSTDKPAGQVIPFTEASAKPRRPFYPMTGNPEAHNYADFVRSLQTGEVVNFPDTTKKPPT